MKAIKLWLQKTFPFWAIPAALGLFLTAALLGESVSRPFSAGLWALGGFFPRPDFRRRPVGRGGLGLDRAPLRVLRGQPPPAEQENVMWKIHRFFMAILIQ